MNVREHLRAIAMGMDHAALGLERLGGKPSDVEKCREQSAVLRTVAARLDAFEETAGICDSVGDFGGALGDEFEKLDACPLAG